MKGFAGFPAGKQPTTSLPELFFSELLPDIDHLGELKVTLYIFWLLSHQTGERRYASGAALAADGRLGQGLGSPDTSPGEALREALARAVARGTLLRVSVGEGAAQRDWYFVNSAKGRQAVQDLLAGKWTPAEPAEALRLQAHRPNIFVLYEQNVGPLTPLLAEELMEAEAAYPASWIEEAFREAVAANVRSWRYIRAILERWAAEGKTDDTARPGDEGDWRRFLKGKHVDQIEH
jgi:DNA replication protein